MGRNQFIDLSKINCKDFRIDEREHPVAGTVFFISPNFDKHSWDRDEFHLRSLIVDQCGEIICSGLPKFRNYGESPDDDSITRSLIAEGKTVYAHKMDGSLLIRTVIDGVVCFRTRGTITVAEDFRDAVFGLINEKYPRLMDPKLSSDVTLTFEYTSPDNHIVVEYDEPKLTFIGAVTYNHSSGLPTFASDKSLINNVCEMFGVDGVPIHDLPDDIDELLKVVRCWSGSEGIVVWGKLDDGRMHLAKIKADEYVRLHSLKYQLSGEKIKRLCWWKGIETYEALKDQLFEYGIDWEFASFIKDDFDNYINKLREVREHIESIKSRIHEEGIYDLDSTKRQAVMLKRIFSKRDFSIAIQYCRGNDQYLERTVYASALGVSMNALRGISEEMKNRYEQYGF